MSIDVGDIVLVPGSTRYGNFEVVALSADGAHAYLCPMKAMKDHGGLVGNYGVFESIGSLRKLRFKRAPHVSGMR